LLRNASCIQKLRIEPKKKLNHFVLRSCFQRAASLFTLIMGGFIY
jgi:hypothetical protein